MSNFLIAYDNQADGATLTAGSYSASLPRDNLKDYRITKKARTTNATAGSTKVRFALTAPCEIGCVALIAGNASVDATYRLQLFSDSGFTTQTYDSGTVDAYPAGSMPNTEIHPDAPNYGTGKPTAAEIARFQRNIVHVLSSAQYAQYGELQITDTTNAAGYLEFGRLFIGRVFEPQNNAAYGDVSLRLTSRSGKARARDGTPYFQQERPDFSVPFSLKWLTEAEAMRLVDMQALVDVHGEVLFLWDHEEPAYAFRRQVFGRLRELDPIEHPLYATYAASFQIEGTLWE
ncbi:MAG TPA: hypothetical protein VGE22_12365 [Solimonas sp.]